MSISTIILTILTTLFGGVNIIQLVNNRQLRRKMSAEASKEETNSLRLIIDGNVAEIARLQQRVDDYSRRYDDLMDKYMSLAEEVRILKQKK